MAQLTFGSDVCSELVNAIQTIVDIFSTERKKCKAVENERDKLLRQMKLLEMEHKQSMEMKCNHSPSDGIMAIDLNESHRKRIKTEQIKQSISTISPYNISNDDLNAAFHEDDIIEPTQYPPSKFNVHKPKKNSPSHNDRTTKDLNKENDDRIANQNISSPIPTTKSPTVLSKQTSKLDIKSSPATKESASKSAIKNTTPRRLFDNWSTTKIGLPSQQPKSNSNTRKKLSLSLNPNTTKLKQSTINFSKKEQCYEQETFCEGMSLEIDNNDLPDTSANLSELVNTTILNESKLTECPSTDNSVCVQNNPNEVIMIDESQSTQDLYEFVRNIKEEINENSPTKQLNKIPSGLIQRSPSVMNTSTANTSTINCEDCDQYHRMLGRDMEKNPPKRYGVCAKHRRKNQCISTPPGFWNAKIIDSDSEHEETPFDPRFLKK